MIKSIAQADIGAGSAASQIFWLTLGDPFSKNLDQRRPKTGIAGVLDGRGARKCPS